MVHIPHEFQEILRSHLPYAETVDFSPVDELASLGLDSMSVVQLLADLESGFDVDIPDDILDEETFATVGSLWLALSTLLANYGRDR
jgi:acyl carrier protein